MTPKITTLEAANGFLDSAIQHLDRFYQAGKPTSVNALEFAKTRGLEDVQLATAAALIAQAEVTERQAVAMERIAAQLERLFVPPEYINDSRDIPMVGDEDQRPPF